MLFHVKMTVNLPLDMHPERAASLKAEEKALAQRLQEEGKWRHLWRIAGHYANYSAVSYTHLTLPTKRIV